MSKLSKAFQKKLDGSSLRSNIKITFTSVFLIPVLTLSLIFVVFLYKTMMDWEMKNVTDSLEQTEVTFNNTLNQILTLSDRIYVNKQLQNVILKNYTDMQELYADYSNLFFMENYLHMYNEVANFRIYTENQSLLNNQFIIKTTSQIEGEEWYQNAKVSRGQPFWIYKTDSLSNKNYLSLIRSVWSSTNGQFVGVLVINIRPDVIQNTLKNKNFETAICLENEMLYTSSQIFNDEERNILINFAKENKDVEKIKKIKMNGKTVRIFTKNFSPANTTTLNFHFMYIIPTNQFNKVTMYILIITIVTILIMIILSFAVIMVFSNYIDERVSKVQTGIDNVIKNNFEIASTIGGKDEFEQIYKALFEMSKKIKDLFERIYIQNQEKEQLAVRQSEISFKMLSNQINPHFLFNTLETIRMKSLASGEKDVATMLKLLASLLRYNLSVKGKPVPLVDEINAVQNYLTIQHMRFGERVSYDIVTMCDIQKITVLPLLIQPIVENSFSHGLEDRVSGGFIYILINSEPKDNKQLLTIKVKDNGCGISDEKLEEINKKLQSKIPEEYSTSIGMINVQSRIKLYYGSEYGLTISSEPGEGTEVTMTMLC
ncbi:MAG: histidine kinase [Treponema sp.]|nr:histidine kinase [Treponema sp.]